MYTVEDWFLNQQMYKNVKHLPLMPILVGPEPGWRRTSLQPVSKLLQGAAGVISGLAAGVTSGLAFP